MTPADLSRLSTLLDEALDLPLSEREAWLGALEGEAAALAATLRRLLARAALKETDDLLERGPAFTAPEFGTLPGAPPAYSPGDTVGPWRLMRELGRGGMGEVWLAERSDGLLKRPVALKLPVLGLRRSVLVQRFERERDILGSLVHPNIARLLDTGLASDGQPYLALEFVDGVPITQYAHDRGLGLRERVQLMRQVMAAVQYAHGHLVIHRDLKPSNVLVTAEGQAQLLDFGVAKLLAEDSGQAGETELTQVGGRALTLEYAAPEQISGAAVSTATDIYALGVLLHELLVGQRPFQGTRRQIEQAVLTQEPARPKALPADLATIVLKALKKAPSERYATVSALADDLQRWQRGEPVLAQPDGAWYRTRRFVGRHTLAVVAAAGVLAAVLATSAVALWQAGVARDQARRAQQQEARAVAVQDFLLGLFRANADAQPDPMRARETTARELLDIGAARVRDRLADTPEAKDAVLSTLSDMYVDVGLSEQAAELAGERVTLREKLYGPDDPRVAEALVDQVNAIDSTNGATLGPQLLLRARRIADRMPPDAVGLRLQVLFAQAQVTRYTDVSASLAFVEEARALIRRSGTTGDPVRRALYLEGLTLGFLGACAQGLERLEEAHRLSVASDGPKPQWQIPEYTAISANAICIGDFERAESALKEALEMSQQLNGPDHIDTMHVLLRLMRLYDDTSRAAEARAIEARLQKLLGDPAVEREANLYATLLRAATLRAWDNGRLDDADALSARLVQAYRRFTGASMMLAGALQSRARVAAAQGKLDEATRGVDEALTMLQRSLGARATATALAPARIDRAMVELWAGRPAAALTMLDAMSANLPPGAPDARSLRPLVARWRAEALRRMGRVTEATAAAQEGLEALAAPLRPADLPRLRADLLLERGLALHASGRFPEARDALAAALALRSANDDETSIWRARAERAQSETLQALGDRRGADELGDRASRRLAATTTAVAPWLSRPSPIRPPQ